MELQPITVKVPPIVQVDPTWLEEAETFRTRVDALVAVPIQEWNEAHFQDATFYLQAMTRHGKALETQRIELTRPFLDLQRRIKALVDQARGPLLEAKDRLQKALAAYYTAKQEEAKKKAAEAPEVVPEGSGAAEVDPKTRKPSPSLFQPKSPAARVREDIQWKVVDEDKVPSHLKKVDPPRVNAFIRKMKPHIKKALAEHGGGPAVLIPGISVWVEKKVVPR